jgi:hypothetical protein
MPRIKSRTDQEILDEVIKCGIVFEVARSGSVTIKAAVKPPPWLRAWLKKHAWMFRNEEVSDEADPPMVYEPTHPREARRDREIADALKALMALAEHGVMVVPIWCPYHAPWESLTFGALYPVERSPKFSPCPKELMRRAIQNTRGICELLLRACRTPRPPGYAVEPFIQYPSPLWLAAVAEADRTGQPPGAAQ